MLLNWPLFMASVKIKPVRKRDLQFLIAKILFIFCTKICRPDGNLFLRFPKIAILPLSRFTFYHYLIRRKLVVKLKRHLFLICLNIQIKIAYILVIRK